MLDKLFLDKSVDIHTLLDIRKFISKNPIFENYVLGLDKVPEFFRNKTSIKKYMIQECCDDTTWENFLKFGFFAENLPEIAHKIIDLPDIKDYKDFEGVISNVIEPSYFEPEIGRWKVFTLYVKICIKFNTDKDTFPFFGIYSKNKELDEPDLLDLWNIEKCVIAGLEKMYEIEINTPNDVYRAISGWYGNHHIGYVLASEIGKKHLDSINST
jgi:hypothetical protein